MINRAKISTSTIANKLKEVEKEIRDNVESDEPKKASLDSLLFVNGRLDRKNYKYVAKNFSLLEGIEIELKKYCKGLDLPLLNYLIYRGIKAIKQDDNFQMIEYSDIEKSFKETLV